MSWVQFWAWANSKSWPKMQATQKAKTRRGDDPTMTSIEEQCNSIVKKKYIYIYIYIFYSVLTLSIPLSLSHQSYSHLLSLFFFFFLFQFTHSSPPPLSSLSSLSFFFSSLFSLESRVWGGGAHGFDVVEGFRGGGDGWWRVSVVVGMGDWGWRCGSWVCWHGGGSWGGHAWWAGFQRGFQRDSGFLWRHGLGGGCGGCCSLQLVWWIACVWLSWWFDGLCFYMCVTLCVVMGLDRWIGVSWVSVCVALYVETGARGWGRERGKGIEKRNS